MDSLAEGEAVAAAYVSADIPDCCAPGSAGVLARLSESVVGVFALCLSFALLLRYNGLFPSVIDWDVSLYAVMAEQWLHGGLPYEAVWDQHPVGLPALFAAILYVFPKSLLALRVSAAVAVAIGASAIYFTARRIDRGYVVPIAAVVLYTAWTSRLWGLAGNTENYLAALISVAMYLFVRAGDESSSGARSFARLSLAALLFGLALQVKHVAIAETALFFGGAIFLALRYGRARAVGAIASIAILFLLPSLVVIAYFWLHGAATDYFHAVVVANLIYASERPSLALVLAEVPRSFIIPIAAVAVAAGIAWKRSDGRTVFILAWAVAAAIDVALPGKFWPHYFLLLMPPAALLAGFAIKAVRDALRRRGERSCFMAVSALVLLASNPMGIYSDSMKARAFGHRDVPEIVANVINEDLSPEDSIFVFNYQPVIYLLTGATLPTRHVLPADWSRQYSDVTRVDPLRELDRVFRARPKYVVFLDTDWVKMGDSALASLHRHLADYERYFVIMDEQILPQPVAVQVYRRRTSLQDAGN